MRKAERTARDCLEKAGRRLSRKDWSAAAAAAAAGYHSAPAPPCVSTVNCMHSLHRIAAKMISASVLKLISI